MPRFHIGDASHSGVARTIDKDVITLGSAPDSDLVVIDSLVSRCHAEIRRDGDDWLIVDLASRHGTLLNGQRVRSPAGLAAGDKISLGHRIVIFEVPVTHHYAARSAPSRPRPVTDNRRSTCERAPILVGDSTAMCTVRALIDRVAASTATVLIHGESGTGKEIVASLIHHRSARAPGPFVVVNCPALPTSLVEAELFGVEARVATGVDARVGRLELAHGGTLLFDEVADLELSAQAKLLRFIQDKKLERIGGRGVIPLDVRILAATNKDLTVAVERGSFRTDLYHRLNSVTIHLPPLSDRREDLPALVDHFLAHGDGPKVSMMPETVARLMSYGFPGNVRELERIVERARILCTGSVITPADLPDLSVCYPAQDRAGSPSMEAAAAQIYYRVVHGQESFWDAIHAPYLLRAVPSEVVRRVVERAYQEAGRSNRQMARLFHIDDLRQYRKLTAFLRNSGLIIRKQAVRRSGAHTQT